MDQPKMIQLETEHLLLRPLSPQDIQALHGPMGNPLTMQFWNEPPHDSLETTRQWVERILANPVHNLWSLYLKRLDEPIGFIRFLRSQRVPNFIYLLQSEY